MPDEGHLSIPFDATSEPAPPRTSPRFEATFGTFSKIVLTNGLMNLPTFWFYRFWGKTRLRRYVWLFRNRARRSVVDLLVVAGSSRHARTARLPAGGALRLRGWPGYAPQFPHRAQQRAGTITGVEYALPHRPSLPASRAVSCIAAIACETAPCAAGPVAGLSAVPLRNDRASAA